MREHTAGLDEPIPGEAPDRRQVGVDDSASTRPRPEPLRDAVAAGATITAYRDGPYLVRGAFKMLAQDGGEIPLPRRTIALCRCGKSQTRPFCDGTHRLVGFRAPGSVDGNPYKSTMRRNGRSSAPPGP